MRKIETIKLSGKDYAQVKDRVKAFREKFPQGRIKTDCVSMESSVKFTAEIFEKKEDENPIASGQSFGTLKGLKAFEKLESISVGRALAFAGFAADGEIASFEEMQDFSPSDISSKLPELNPLSDKWEKAKENVKNGSIDLDGLRKHWIVSDEAFKKLQS